MDAQCAFARRSGGPNVVSLRGTSGSLEDLSEHIEALNLPASMVLLEVRWYDFSLSNAL